MTTISWILLLVIVVLITRNSSMRTKNRDLQKRKTNAENSASIYFTTLMQYRDLITSSNIKIPDNFMGVSSVTNEADETEYDTNDILDEINDKGIENISESKLNYLKSKNKQGGKS